MGTEAGAGPGELVSGGCCGQSPGAVLVWGLLPVTAGVVRPMHYLVRRAGHIAVEHTVEDAAFAGATLAHLAEAASLLSAYFGLPEPFAPIRAILTPSRLEFERCVLQVLGVAIEIPSHPRRVAQPQGRNLAILSPRAWESVNTYTPGCYWRLLLHEVVHMVEEHLSPDMEAVPRWWSEGLAMYLSEQWKYEDEERLDVLKGLAGGNVPPLSRLHGRGNLPREVVELCYIWGWTVVMFVDQHYGRAGIRRVVQGCGDGDVFALLGTSVEETERAWREWLRGFSEAFADSYPRTALASLGGMP